MSKANDLWRKFAKMFQKPKTSGSASQDTTSGLERDLACYKGIVEPPMSSTAHSDTSNQNVELVERDSPDGAAQQDIEKESQTIPPSGSSTLQSSANVDPSCEDVSIFGEQTLESIIHPSVLEMASQAAGQGGNVVIFATQFIDQRQNYSSHNYEFSGGTLQTAENITTTNVTESGKREEEKQNNGIFQGDGNVVSSSLTTASGDPTSEMYNTSAEKQDEVIESGQRKDRNQTNLKLQGDLNDTSSLVSSSSAEGRSGIQYTIKSGEQQVEVKESVKREDENQNNVNLQGDLGVISSSSMTPPRNPTSRIHNTSAEKRREVIEGEKRRYGNRANVNVQGYSNITTSSTIAPNGEGTSEIQNTSGEQQDGSESRGSAHGPAMTKLGGGLLKHSGGSQQNRWSNSVNVGDSFENVAADSSPIGNIPTQGEHFARENRSTTPTSPTSDQTVRDGPENVQCDFGILNVQEDSTVAERIQSKIESIERRSGDLQSRYTTCRLEDYTPSCGAGHTNVSKRLSFCKACICILWIANPNLKQYDEFMVDVARHLAIRSERKNFIELIPQECLNTDYQSWLPEVSQVYDPLLENDKFNVCLEATYKRIAMG